MKALAALASLLAAAGCASPERRCAAMGSPDEGLTEELTQARQADYDANYDLALQITGKVISRKRRDVEEAKAWEIRGSTYYLMGRSGRAKASWKRAYVLDPCMKEIPDLLKKLDAPK